MRKVIIVSALLVTFIACKHHNADYYYNKGVIAYGNRQYDEALKQYDKAISLLPTEAAFYLNRGAVREELGDRKGALEDYHKSLTLDSLDAIVYNNIANIFAEEGKKEEAILYYEKAISLDSTYFYTYLNNAITKYEIKDYDGALVQLSKYMKYAPNTHFAAAFYYVGMSYKNLGNADAAREFLNEAKELGFKEAETELKNME